MGHPPTRRVQSAFVSWLLTLLHVCLPCPCSFSFSFCPSVVCALPSERTGLVRGTHGEGLVSTALTQAAGTPASSSKSEAAHLAEPHPVRGSFGRFRGLPGGLSREAGEQPHLQCASVPGFCLLILIGQVTLLLQDKSLLHFIQILNHN